jgi:hypothetical protein
LRNPKKLKPDAVQCDLLRKAIAQKRSVLPMMMMRRRRRTRRSVILFTCKIITSSLQLDIVTRASGVQIENELQTCQRIEVKSTNDLIVKSAALETNHQPLLIY